MENYQIKGEDGNMYWVHRALTVSAFVFKSNRDGLFILANKRGSGTPDNQGKWNCPCGYLDFEETLISAAVREIREETGVLLTEEDLACFETDDNPDSHLQNVTVRFLGILDENDIVQMERNPAEGEENEVEEVKWINLEEINNYDWAYNHNTIILRALNLMATAISQNFLINN